METDLFEPIQPSHADCLRDESRRAGRADTVSFPRSEDDVRRALAECAARNLRITVQGARTGITGGAVPDGGHILNLSRMKAVTAFRRDPEADRFLVTVQPGVLLADLNRGLETFEFDATGWSEASRQAWSDFRSGKPYFFPPDPTETTASLGGMISCNASGACSLHYGPTRKYVAGLRVVLADGSAVSLRRGQPTARGRAFSLAAGGGRRIEGRLPSYALPSVKNAAGYFAADDMDLVDLFIGSEGTLGVVAEAELLLVPAPALRWGVTAFFPAERDAVSFVRRIRGDQGVPGPAPEARPAAIEFFDCHVLDLLRGKRGAYAVLADTPEVPPGSHTAVYAEYHEDEEDALMDAMEVLSEIIVACRGDEAATWTATDAREMKRLHDFRHAVPEVVNLVIDERRKQFPDLTKLGTDMAVPDAELENVMALYHRALDASGLEYVLFGHIGDNHVHVNILPRSHDEYELGRKLYLDWAREVIRMGGTVSAEHGIGKLKVALLKEMYGEKGIVEMKDVKRLFDPEFRLNRGNLFEVK
ncbi:MAG: FAD-binding oxidoreductase [Verrucomicrobiota bacterium]